MGFGDAYNDRSFRLLLLAGPILTMGGIVGWSFTRPPPIPDPDVKWGFGCYVSKSAPPILLNDAGFHVVQKSELTLPFKLVRSKMGIVLSIKAPLNVAREQDGYRYYVADRKGGLSLSFYKIEGDRSYGIFDESHLFRFQIYAEDRTIISYERADNTRCDEK